MRALLSEQFPGARGPLGEARGGGVRQLGVGGRRAVGVSLPASRDRGAARRARSLRASSRRPAASGSRACPHIRRSGERALPAPVLRPPAAERRRAGGCEPHGRAAGVARSRRRAGSSARCMPLRRCEAADGERMLPVDPNRRAEMPFRVQMTRDRLGAIEDLQPATRRRVEQILAEAEKLAPSTTNVLLHGDLHVRHVLVEQGTLSGVIDWGDVCVGDPSIDLLFVWSAVAAWTRDVDSSRSTARSTTRQRYGRRCSRSTSLPCSPSMRATRGSLHSSARPAPGSSELSSTSPARGRRGSRPDASRRCSHRR